MLDDDHTGCRLVHGESDGLPGVVADRYGEVVVLQLLSAGAERGEARSSPRSRRHAGATCIVERSDAEVRALEGLEPRVGVVHGTLPDDVELREAGLHYGVDVLRGQKTGFYLDQRDNRRLVGAHARGRSVLNAFCYTGGFTLAALAGGAADVTSIDSSREALALARANLARNARLDASRADWIEADVFARASQASRRGEVVRPRSSSIRRNSRRPRSTRRAPRAPTRTSTCGRCGCCARAACSQRSRARAACRPTCSRRSSPAPRWMRRPTRRSSASSRASADHPVALNFPEGEYLKGLLVLKR